MEEGSKTRHRGVTVTRIVKATAIVLFALLISASLIYVVNDLFDSPHSTIGFSPVRYLGVVENVRFWQSENRFTWDEVRHSTYYLIEADGAHYTVYANEWVCPSDVSCGNVRIKAVDATGRYRDSDWCYFTAAN